MTLAAALQYAKAHGVAIRHVDWVPGRTLTVIGVMEALVDSVPTPVWHDGKMTWHTFSDDYTPTYAEAVSDGWEVVP